MNTLKLENISVKTQNKQILKNISLNIKEKEIVVILGPNGAGKSTIAHAIMGNDKYEVTGKILLNNTLI